MQMSMFSAEELHVSRSASPDFARDWLTQGGTSPSHILPLLQNIAPVGWFGKTCPAYCPRYPTHLPIRVRRTSTWTVMTDPKTGKKYWSLTNTQQSKHMRFGVSWPERRNSAITAGSSVLTLSTSKHRAFPMQYLKGVSVCSLSDILETGDVPQRYFLTARACRGILRRAEKRGKALPSALHQALRSVAERAAEPQS